MSEEEVRARLADAGRRLAEADAARRAALDDIAAAMRDGHGLVNIKEMSTLAGVSRVTAYRMLDQGE